MKRIQIFFLISILFINYITAQISVVGKVVDKITTQPIEFANVVVLMKNTSSYITGVTTDIDGNFSIKLSEPIGNYKLRISYVGYKDIKIDIVNSNLGIIELEGNSQLSEVTIEGKVQPFKIVNGGIVANINNSRLKDIGTVSDILGQLPLITKIDNKYTVFGKGAPLIYIDNRLIRDLSELERLDSEQIKEITIITNPGAEYDATVKSVIKVETIKQAGEGVSGYAMERFTINKKYTHNELIGFNIRNKRFDIFCNLSFKESKNLVNWNKTINSVTDKKVIVKEIDKQNDYSQFIIPNIGLNYSWPNNASIGIKYEMPHIKFDFDNNSDLNVFFDDILQNQINSRRSWNRKEKKHYINAYYKGNPLSWIQVKLNMDYYKGYTDEYQGIDNQSLSNIDTIQTSGYQNYDLYATKLLIKTPLWNGDLNYGGEYSYTETKQTFDVDSNNSTDLKPDNNFAKQNETAAFISYNILFNKISANVGLRYENVGFSYYENNKKIEEQSHTFNNLFPNIDISYSNENIQVMLGYLRSIDRPSYWQLRNSIRYSSVYLYEIGNPYLQPTFTNSFSFLFKWKDFQLSTSYDRTKDYIAFLLHQYSENPDIILTRFENIDKFQNLSISGLYTTQVKIWRPSLEISMQKNFVEYNSQKFNRPIFSFKLKNSIKLINNLIIGCDLRYNTTGYTDLNYYYNNFRTDIYLSKSFLQEKLRINLKGDDIFGTDKWNNLTKMNNTSLRVKGNINRQSVSFSISYRFNVTPNRYKGERASDEINRL